MVLDTTVGGVSAVSYLTVAEADAIAGTRIGPYAEKWAAADEATKEKALQTATRDVDEHVGPSTSYSTTQALEFPRADDLDAASNPIILKAVREATYEQAVYLLVNAQALANAATRRAQAMFTFNQPDVSGSITIDPEFGRFSPDAHRLLAGLPESHSGVASVPLTTGLFLDGPEEDIFG